MIVKSTWKVWDEEEGDSRIYCTYADDNYIIVGPLI